MHIEGHQPKIHYGDTSLAGSLDLKPEPQLGNINRSDAPVTSLSVKKINSHLDTQPLISAVSIVDLTSSDTEIVCPEEFFKSFISLKSYSSSGLPKLVEAIGTPALEMTRYSMVRWLANPATSNEEILARRHCFEELQSRPDIAEKMEGLLSLLNKKCLTQLTGIKEVLNIFSTEQLTSTKDVGIWDTVKLFFASKVIRDIRTTIGLRRLKQSLTILKELENCNSPILRDIGVRASEILESPAAKHFKGKIGIGLKGINPIESVKNKFSLIKLRIAGLSATKMTMLVASSTVFISVFAGLARSLEKKDLLNKAGATAAQLQERADQNSVEISKVYLQITLFSLAIMGINRLFAHATSKYFASLRNSKLNQVPDLIAEIDALITLSKFDQRTAKLGWKFATNVNLGTYYFASDKLHNPVLALKTDLKSVPNDIELIEGLPMVISGGNSGGKTTYASSVVMFTMLNQSGLRQPADRCSQSIVDNIVCRGPIHSVLGKHGRLGNELLESNEAILDFTPSSLAILDEGIGGTSEREGREIAAYINEGFRDIGGGVIVITHDPELAEDLSTNYNFQPYTPEILKDEATFKLIKGVAQSSGAQRVAKDVKMTREDVRLVVNAKRLQAGKRPLP